MLPVVLLQPPYRTGGEKHVRVATEDRFSPRLTEHPILRRCCTPHLCREYIPRPVHPTFHQLLGCRAAVVIEYQQFRVPQVLIQAEGLQGEIDAAKIVIRRHPDGQRDHAINPLPGSQNHPEYSPSLAKCTNEPSIDFIDFAPSGEATIRLGLLRLSLGPPGRRRLLPRLSCLRHPPAPLMACPKPRTPDLRRTVGLAPPWRRASYPCWPPRCLPRRTGAWEHLRAGSPPTALCPGASAGRSRTRGSRRELESLGL